MFYDSTTFILIYMSNENCITTGQHWLFSKKKIKLTHRYYSRDLTLHSSHAWTFYNYIVYNYDIHVPLLQFSMMLSPPPQTLHDSESDQREITLIHCYYLQYYHAKQCDFNLLYMKNFFFLWVSFHFVPFTFWIRWGILLLSPVYLCMIVGKQDTCNKYKCWRIIIVFFFFFLFC